MKEAKYAVAVRDGGRLLLYKWIKRTKNGDVYVFWPNDSGDGNSHASYHADGRLHVRHGGRIPLPPQMLQKPDASFRGVQGIVHTPIDADEVRALNRICEPSEFSCVFEISGKDITHQTHGEFQLSVHLAEPNALVDPGWETLREWTFRDEVPWIVATLSLMNLPQ